MEIEDILNEIDEIGGQDLKSFSSIDVETGAIVPASRPPYMLYMVEAVEIYATEKASLISKKKLFADMKAIWELLTEDEQIGAIKLCYNSFDAEKVNEVSKKLEWQIL